MDRRYPARAATAKARRPSISEQTLRKCPKRSDAETTGTVTVARTTRSRSEA